MSRIDSGLINLIDNAEKELEELKTAQIFGSDSMNINVWSKELTPGYNNYRVTLTPKAGSRGLLPMEISIQLPTSFLYGYEARPIFRYDGTFQWNLYISGQDNMKIMLRWIGAGTVTWEQI